MARGNSAEKPGADALTTAVGKTAPRKLHKPPIEPRVPRPSTEALESTFRAPAQRIFSVLHAAESFVHIMEHQLAPLGLTWAKFLVLRRVAVHGEAVAMGDLALACGTGNSNMTKTVDALEELGLVSRAPDAQDRRTQRVSLTRMGEREHERALLALVVLEDDIAGIDGFQRTLDALAAITNRATQ